MTALNDIALSAISQKNILTPSISTSFLAKGLAKSLYSRIENYILQLTDYLLMEYYVHPKMNKILQNTGKLSGLPSVTELSRRSELVLFNYDPVIDTPEQLPPNVIGVGGLQIKEAKPLPEVRPTSSIV